MQTLSTSVSSMATAAAGTGPATGITLPVLAARRAAAARCRGAAARRPAHRQVRARCSPPACPGRASSSGAAGVPRHARPRRRRTARSSAAPVRLGAGRRVQASSAGLLVDPLSMAFVLLVTFVGSLIHVYSLGLHGARPRQAPLLRLPQPLRRVDAPARPRRLLPAALRRLGGRRPRVVPAHRLLELQPGLRDRGQQGVRRQPRRRLRPVHRDHADVRRRSARVDFAGVNAGVGRAPARARSPPSA